MDGARRPRGGARGARARRAARAARAAAHSSHRDVLVSRLQPADNPADHLPQLAGARAACTAAALTTAAWVEVHSPPSGVIQQSFFAASSIFILSSVTTSIIASLGNSTT